MFNLFYDSTEVHDLFEAPDTADVSPGNGITLFQAPTKAECLAKITELALPLSDSLQAALNPPTE